MALTSEKAESGHSSPEALIPGANDGSVRDSPKRFVLLLFSACMMFGNYYFFDQTSATQDALLEHVGMSDNTFGLLASVYSWPNIILPLFGGLFIDKMGVKAAAITFTTFVMLGSMLFTLGIMSKSIPCLICGRIIFGIGGESQNVAALTLVSKWFIGRELAFSTAILISVSRLGSVAVFDSQPALITHTSITFASAVTSGICLFSLCTAMFAVLMDWKADRQDAQRGITRAADVDEAAKLSDLTKLERAYWLVSISCVSVYVAAFPFMQVISSPYLKQRFGFGADDADHIVSYINLASAFLSPLLGLFVDRFGRRPMLLVSSSVCFGCCHVAFLLWPDCYHCYTIVGVYVLMGVALSIYGSVVWPCVPLVVDKSVVGTAFGVTTSMQNFGMAISPMILTALNSSTGEFTWPFVYIIGCCSIGSVAGMVLWIIDKRRGGKLSKSAAESDSDADASATLSASFCHNAVTQTS